MITLKDITDLQLKELNTLSSKIIYLMIRNGSNQEGWSAISINDFSTATGMTTRATFKVISKLKSNGLIECNTEKERLNAVNQYRIINP
tara:strand:+ start:579 stop:845 length:267 start_codon:yes stop_codon:yes gene_type:complete